jgi:hypothetical protein
MPQTDDAAAMLRRTTSATIIVHCTIFLDD